MTDLSAGPEIWWPKVNEPDTSGQYPDPTRNVRSAWVEPDENEEGEYILCIQTRAQVCVFDVGPKHFADELAKAINDGVQLASPDPEAIRQKRIAELQLELSGLEAENEAATQWGAAVGARWERIKGIRAELSRLHNDAAEPIPDDVYFHEGNFYSVVSRQGMGPEFFNKWQNRRDEFPGRPSPSPSPEPQDVREIARAILSDIDAGKVDACYISPYHSAGLRKALAAIAQSDAQQPVGWQYRWNANGRKSEWFAIPPAQLSYYHKLPEYEVRPLYTAPPRPDASGLIETAEWPRMEGGDTARVRVLRDDELARLKEHLHDFAGKTPAGQFNLGVKKLAQLLYTIEHYRSGAADRSAPRSDKGGA